MKSTIYLFLLVFVLLSCSNENDPGKIYSLETLQSNTVNQFHYGEQRFMEINEMDEDISNQENYQIKIHKLYQFIKEIDSLTGIHISMIEKMKMDMFQSFGEELSVKKENSILYYDFKKYKASRPISYLLSHVKYTGESDVLNSENRKIIVEAIRKYRKEVCEIIEKSIYIEENMKPFFFKDPNINNFKDAEDFNAQYDREIKKSNIVSDDVEAIKKIYHILSKTDKQWESIMGGKKMWIDAVSVLLSIENDILLARAFAYDLMRCRIGCGASYNFSSILPIVNGPSAALSGDTIELKIFMAAFNAYAEPEYKIFGGGQLVKIKNGIGYVKVIIPKSKEIEIKGNITIKNKSGIPKTNEWSHKIKVVSKQ